MIIKFSSKFILISILLVGAGLACNLPIATESTPTITSVPTLAISTLPPVTYTPPAAIQGAVIEPNETIETTETTTATATMTPTPCIPVMPEDWISYDVQPGDTIFSLADERGTTADVLMEVNCRDSTIVSEGDVLFVPQENISVQTTAEPFEQSPTSNVTRVPTEIPPDTPRPAPLPTDSRPPPDDPIPKPPR